MFFSEPYPPPGLNRVIPGQPVSFDDGLNSPPFARIVPGEGKDPADTYQLFSSAPKVTLPYAHNFHKDNVAYSSASKDFFDNYLPKSNVLDEPKSNQPPKNKFPNTFFPDTDKRELYMQPNSSQLPPSSFDNSINEKSDLSFNNFHHRPASAHNKPVLKENVQFEGSTSHVGANKSDSVPKFDGNKLQDNNLTAEHKERAQFYQNNVNSTLEADKSENNLPPNRMAIEGSCDNGPYSKSISSSTPVQSPSYDYWYSNNVQTAFNEYTEVKNAHSDDPRQTRDQNTFYAKSRNLQPVQAPLSSHFAVPQNTHDPQHAHSKTPSLSSNTSSLNEPSSYQPESYNVEPKRNEHFSSTEVTDPGNASGNFDIQTGNNVKPNAERMVKNVDTRKNDEYPNETRQHQKFEANRKNFEPSNRNVLLIYIYITFVKPSFHDCYRHMSTINYRVYLFVLQLETKKAGNRCTSAIVTKNRLRSVRLWATTTLFQENARPKN